jgi:hypothetical protein
MELNKIRKFATPMPKRKQEQLQEQVLKKSKFYLWKDPSGVSNKRFDFKWLVFILTKAGLKKDMIRNVVYHYYSEEKQFNNHEWIFCCVSGKYITDIPRV